MEKFWTDKYPECLLKDIASDQHSLSYVEETVEINLGGFN